jgi:hypothetical protein
MKKKHRDHRGGHREHRGKKEEGALCVLCVKYSLIECIRGKRDDGK